MTQEALKLALEWFKCYADKSMSRNNAEALADEVVEAIEKALAQTQELDAIASILACRNMLDAQPVPEVDRVIWPESTEQDPVAVYGYCPQCGAKGVMRERRPNGNDKCANGHTYPSSTSTPPQRTWVGLTDEEVRKICVNEWGGYEQCRAIEAKLKEKNT